MLDKLISAGIAVLEVSFALGVLGSAVVILLTTLEDSKVLLSKEDVPPLPAEAHR